MIDQRVPTEHLEAADVQLQDAHREALQQLATIAGPFLLGVIGFMAVRKKRKEVRAELAARAEAVRLEAPEQETPSVDSDSRREHAFRVIAEELPGWAHLAEIDGHFVVVENETRRLVCSVVNPIELVSSGDLSEWCDRLRPGSGG